MRAGSARFSHVSRTRSTPIAAPFAVLLGLAALAGCSSTGAASDTRGGDPDSGGVVGADTDAASASGTAGSGTPDGSSAPRADSGSRGGDLDGGSAASDASRGDSAAPGATDAGGSDILVPAQGALLGHFYGNGTLAATDALIGRKPRLHLNYYDWVTDWSTDSTLTDDFADGRVPIVNWEPYDANGKMIDFAGILNGSFDAQITSRARNAQALGKKLFLDFAAEMNSDESWTNHDAAQYVAAWRHIHDIFVAAGATNVIWAWCPNVTDSDNTNAATMSYYPGDAYVDWTGVDGYNWGTSDPSFGWQTFQEVFKDIYPLLAKVGKPILIGEMASDEVGGSKAQWVDDLIPTLKADFPMIKAFVWFDIKKERAWQINSSPTALASYSKMALDPYMNP